VQYTAQLLLPVVEKCIDDVQYENYNIPTLLYGSRVLINKDKKNTVGEFAETDYVDARVEKQFNKIELPFVDIENAEDLDRLTFINEQLKKLVANKPVSDKLMHVALTEDQMRVYIDSIDSPVHASEVMYGDGMPDELHDYNIMLRKADFQYNKFDNMSLKQVRGVKFGYGVVTTESDKADSLYEDVLERLHEIWDLASPSHRYRLQCWFDREIDFEKGHDTKISIDPDNIVRVRGSRSARALDSGLPKLSKRLKRKECQLIALRDALIELTFVKVADIEVETKASSQNNKKLYDLINYLPGDEI